MRLDRRLPAPQRALVVAVALRLAGVHRAAAAMMMSSMRNTRRSK